MNREFFIAFLVSLAAHVSVVGICNPMHDRNEGEQGEDRNIVLVGIVELSAPAALEIPAESPRFEDREERIPTDPATPPPAFDEPLALIVPEPELSTDSELAEPPGQNEEMPAEVPMVEHHAYAGIRQTTSGQIEDVRVVYLRAMLKKLEETKRYPRLAYRRGLEGTVELRFTVFGNGHVSYPEIRRSSGYASLDGEAVKMVCRARPFHPIPAELELDHMNLTVPVAFRIQ